MIAGGGLVGLSVAMFLAQHGVSSLAIERLRGGSQLPRAAFFHMRTIEMFRAAGIEDEVREQSLKEFSRKARIVLMDTLSGKQLAAFIPSLNEGVDALSPCRRLFITQPGLEPILRRRAEVAGAKVLDGHEVIGVAQDADGVTVTAQEEGSGKEVRLRGKYLIGADGAHSKVRELLGVEFDGRGVFSNSITIYFRANLAPLLLNKPLSVIYISNPVLGGFFRMDKDCQSGFLCVNTVGDPKVDPVAASNAAADISEQRLIEFVRAGVGDPNLPVKIDGIARWRATSDVARRFKVGRVFLAGDAAHLMPPNGGFGGNTGIHDAHNLAWKLAMVLQGEAGPNCSRPTRSSASRSASSPSSRPTRAMSRAPRLISAPRTSSRRPTTSTSSLAISTTRRAIVSEKAGREGARRSAPDFGRPGSRAPHVWLERDGKQVSTIDLAGRTFMLIAGPEGGAWCDAAHARPRSSSWHQARNALRQRQRTARSGRRLPAGLRPARRRRGADPAGRVRRLARDIAAGRSGSRDGVGAAIDPAGAVTRLVARRPEKPGRNDHEVRHATFDHAAGRDAGGLLARRGIREGTQGGDVPAADPSDRRDSTSSSARSSRPRPMATSRSRSIPAGRSGPGRSSNTSARSRASPTSPTSATPSTPRSSRKPC